ncbi:NDP-hexose 2,3-dehydratase family protein [Pontibacter pamirensis]|uniref:NDP-hexose 2,3-dehydratase family protein n=1 Tax=Pontibacter pamirensis TaxID=2562824 RepID=UPI00138A2CA8|nr:NDP-hexose 2,3-dehydratase family protein [Pontibacter pamirensis]
MKEQNLNLKFIKSALSVNNPFNDITQVREWVKEQNSKVSVNIKRITFDQLEQWHFSENGANLQHDSGKFFSIDGIKVHTNWGGVSEWEQPIINQPEIGYLGFVTKEFDGVLHFLLQAKIEPGNVNNVQLSPTLQATKSNYTQVHKGKAPAYLDLFVNARPEQVLLDQLQSEQGARFLKKRNRNIVIKVDHDIPLYDNFIWLTLAQIKLLMVEDNLVNMDTRTVISGIPFGDLEEDIVDFYNDTNPSIKENRIASKLLKSTLVQDKALHTSDDIISFITKQKSFFELHVERVPLSSISDWKIEADSIRHVDDKYFKVIATKVEIENREVVSWCQPMVEPAQEGICAFVCKEIDGMLHFAVQTKLEAGNFDIIEFAPTVQCLTGNYRTSGIESLPFLAYVLDAKPDQIIFDTIQSEEGGRFYKEQNRNMLVLAGDDVELQLPENYIWMTLNQLQTFIKFNNYVNIQARSLIAAVSFMN